MLGLYPFYSEITSAIKKAYFSAFKQEATEFFFERPPKNGYGDIALVCFHYSKQLKKSPAQIAQSLSDNFVQPPQILKIGIIGGYLNFFFDAQYLADLFFDNNSREEFLKGISNIGKSQKYIIEFSAPNANKPLHLGHGRNNAIGLFFVRLSRYLGYSSLAANLINDRGIHICKSILTYKKSGAVETPDSSSKKGDHFVGDYYVAFASLVKENPEYEKDAQEILQLWEDNDKEIRELWKKMTRWVIDGFKETYNRAGIEFEFWYYESQTYSKGKQIILKALEDGICYRTADGAVAIDLSEQNLGTKILLRRDGTSVYITQDIYTTSKKFADFNADGAFWVVGAEQEHHFKVLFAVLEKLGFAWVKNCFHISYGMIELPDGKMKSREGNTVDLDDLYDDMQNEAYQLILQKGVKKGVRTEQELLTTAEFIGQAAINFFILRSNANKSITFDRRESLNFDGMSGPYLQYTFARISSLLKRVGASHFVDNSKEYIPNLEERSLLVQIGFFNEVLANAWHNKNPSFVAHYTYELCRNFNKFYYMHPVLDARDESIKIFRSNLALLVKDILGKCLYLMNIKELSYM